MSAAVTWASLIHVGLLIAFIISLGGIAWFWLNFFAAAMSDGQPAQHPWILWMAFAHGLPVALLIAWWVT